MTTFSYAKEQAIIQTSLKVMDYIYIRGTQDGESGYLPGELYSTTDDLYGKSKTELKNVITNLQLSLSTKAQANLIKDILAVADKYYFQGNRAGASGFQAYDFASDYGDEAEAKIKAILQKY